MLLNFGEISVNNIVAAVILLLIEILSACTCCACVLSSACLSARSLVDLLGESVECLLESICLSLDIVCVIGLDSFLQLIELSFDRSLVLGCYLVAEVLQSLFAAEDHVVCTVLDVNGFLTLLIFLSVLLSFLDSLVDVVLGHIRRCCDGDILHLACAHILSGYMNDTVCVDIECYFDLRDSSGSGSDTVKTEDTELLVILSEFTFALEDIDINSSLIVCICGEYL